MWSVEIASYSELCDVAQRMEDARHPTYKILVEDTARLKERILRGAGRENNSDWNYLSLSTLHNSAEGAAARHQKGSFAPPVPSEKELEVLIRDASSQILSASDVLSKVLPWVESKEKLIEIISEPDTGSRVKIFQNLMGILWLRFRDFWDIEVSVTLSFHR